MAFSGQLVPATDRGLKAQDRVKKAIEDFSSMLEAVRSANPSRSTRWPRRPRRLEPRTRGPKRTLSPAMLLSRSLQVALTSDHLESGGACAGTIRAISYV